VSGIVGAPISAVLRVRDGVIRRRVRRRLMAAAWGNGSRTSVTLLEPGVGRVIEDVTAGMALDSWPLRRLVAVLMNSGSIDAAVERLDAKFIPHRVGAARTIGALRLHDAVGRVAPLLAAKERVVVDAAARALGRIGGAQSADAILFAIHRRGASRRFVAELARSAPDMFLESALGEPFRPSVRAAVALAAGLRRRRTATSHLIALVHRGSRRERVVSCRALGWIGATTAIEAVTSALDDRDWKVRMSAAKALGALRAHAAARELHELVVADRNPRVREAARLALRRMEAHGA
jgi:HEAT repeat protein